MTLGQTLTIIIIAYSILGCDGDQGKKKQTPQGEVKQGLGNLTDQELSPHYKTVYTPDSVKLEEFDATLKPIIIDQWACLDILSNSCKELKADYNNYLLYEYKVLSVNDERLAYSDIGNVARFIVWKFKSNDTGCFDQIFKNAEIILKNGDETTKNLIVVGLFEGIQNIGGWHKVDYYKGFNRWLRPKSKQSWDDLIANWEGEESD